MDLELIKEYDLTTREYIEGVHLFRGGDEVKEAFLLYSGKIRVYRKENGIERELAILEPGDILGEMSLITNKEHRTSSAIALEKSLVVIITPELLKEKIAEADPLIRTMISMFTKRLYNSNEK